MSLRLADAALFIAVLNRRDRFHSVEQAGFTILMKP